jgi:hypothetical protein
VFTNTRGEPIEPNSLLPHWYAAQRACGIRVRGLYSTKDTFVSTALLAGVRIAWLEEQTGVDYATLRKHYGVWMPRDGESELDRFVAADPTLFRTDLPPILPPGDEKRGAGDEKAQENQGRRNAKGGIRSATVTQGEPHWTLSCFV